MMLGTNSTAKAAIQVLAAKASLTSIPLVAKKCGFRACTIRSRLYVPI